MIWIALSLLLIGLAFVMLLLLGSKETDEKLDPRTEADRKQDGVPVFLKEYLAKNGVELPPQAIYVALSLAAAGLLLSLLTLPINMAATAFIGIPTLLFLGVKSLGAKRRKKMIDQLPSFINQVTRRLSAGISVENAFSDSVETLEAPLGTVMRRVVRRVYMGEELHRAFDREANLNRLNEFSILATAMKINEQYGGSMRSILDDIVSILRLDESSKKELSAMTGETRFTAFVLAVIPIAIAGYMFAVNPELIQNMLENTGGKIALIVAVGMEITGMIIMWRMIKSIGS